MTNDWNARPFEEFYTIIPKQQVQFPSVTVCPAGKENSQMKFKTWLILLFYYLSPPPHIFIDHTFALFDLQWVKLIIYIF